MIDVARDFARAFYKSKEWKKVRGQALERDNYECQRCKSKGLFGKAECVHHVIHLRDNPRLGLELGNLTSLCLTCHNEVHPEKFKKNEIKNKIEIAERW